jgi:hypothetical protein
VQVSIEDVMMAPSRDMPPSAMLALARHVRDAITDARYTEVVVAHGADSLEETAHLLAGKAAIPAAIVFTGRRLRTEGPRNLAAAITAAGDPACAGRSPRSGDYLHTARWTTYRGTTFSSGPSPPLASPVLVRRWLRRSLSAAGFAGPCPPLASPVLVRRWQRSPTTVSCRSALDLPARLARLGNPPRTLL